MPKSPIDPAIIDGLLRGAAQSPGTLMATVEDLRNLGLGQDMPRYGPGLEQRGAEWSGIPAPTTPGGRIAEGVGRQIAPLVALGGPGMAATGGLGAIAAEAGLGLAGLTAAETAREKGVGGLGQFIADIGTQLTPGLAAKGIAGKLAVIPAFHGTPHKWGVHPKLGRVAPNMDRISTGEGAQAFGYGHYSAQKEGVARDYHSVLTDSDMQSPMLMVDDKPFLEVWDDLDADISGDVYEMLTINGYDDTESILSKRASGQRWDSDQAAYDLEELRKLKGRVSVLQPDELGGVYGLLHDVNPEDLLDLDAPISQQSPKVREALDRAGLFRQLDETEIREWYEKGLADIKKKDKGWSRLSDDVRDSFEWENLTSRQKRAQERRYSMETGRGADGGHAGWYRYDADPTGAEIISVDVAEDGMLPEDVSRRLREAGIPGSMYYDRMSRGAGEGTRNYVMFRDDLTYIDPSRTDPRLWEQLPIGEPFRTVEPKTK